MKSYLIIAVAISSLVAVVLGGIPQYGKFGYGLVIHHPGPHGYGYGGKSYQYHHRLILPSHHHSFGKHIGFDYGHDHHEHDHDHGHGHGHSAGYEIEDGGHEFGQENIHAGGDFQFDDDIGGGYP